MIHQGRAREIKVCIDTEQVLQFAPKPGSYFVAWGADAAGYLSIRSGDFGTLFAPGEWTSISFDEYHLKADMH